MSDYVIVGGGSAGCVLANRLSADPDVTVTLLEAGADDRSILFRMPAGYFQLMKTGRGNWKHETVPQPGLGDRAMYIPAGKVLGGSSMVNGMVFIRGNAGDFDGWAQRGNHGWSWEDCLPYFRRLEAFEGGADDYRGAGGPVSVTKGAHVEEMSPISRAWVEGGMLAGYPYNPDFNGAAQEGFGPASGNFGQGSRQSTSQVYLEPIRHRPNLTVVTRAHTSRILLEGDRAVGVEYIRAGKLERSYAEREVILSAGALASPKILQLSGIGEPGLLKACGVPVACDLPGVGANLQDHLSVSVLQKVTKPYSALGHLSALKMVSSLVQYSLFKSGPALTNGLEAAAFIKSRLGLEYSDIQYHLPLLMYEDHGRKVFKEEGFQAHATYCHPRSRGSIRIVSSNPADAPAIDPNYLGDPEDLQAMRTAIRVAREVIRQTPFDDFRGAEFAPGEAVQSDADLDAYIRRTASSVYHYAGSCRMGADPMAVVDADLRVRGVAHLRVVDASVMPCLPTGNTNATTMMIAEKASDMIAQRIPLAA